MTACQLAIVMTPRRAGSTSVILPFEIVTVDSEMMAAPGCPATNGQDHG